MSFKIWSDGYSKGIKFRIEELKTVMVKTKTTLNSKQTLLGYGCNKFGFKIITSIFMNKFSLSQFLILFCLVCGTTVNGQIKGSTSARPNIIFILSDDDATNAISAYNDLYKKQFLQKYINDVIPKNIFNSMDTFFGWYRINQLNLDLKKILKKNIGDESIKKYYDVLFNSIRDRLHY